MLVTVGAGVAAGVIDSPFDGIGTGTTIDLSDERWPINIDSTAEPDPIPPKQKPRKPIKDPKDTPEPTGQSGGPPPEPDCDDDEPEETWCHYGSCNMWGNVPAGKYATKSCDLPFGRAVALTNDVDFTFSGKPLCQFKCNGAVEWLEGGINGTLDVEGYVVTSKNCTKSVVPRN